MSRTSSGRCSARTSRRCRSSRASPATSFSPCGAAAGRSSARSTAPSPAREPSSPLPATFAWPPSRRRLRSSLPRADSRAPTWAPPGCCRASPSPLPAPRAEPKDDATARDQRRECLGNLGAAGWLLPIRDQDWRACCVVREALAAASPLADAVFALQALGVVPMLLSANDAMRKRWLEPAIQGRAMASFAMTEPDAGSDVASLGATAEPNGDGYVLSGTKTFISNAGIADFYTVFATTDRAKKDKGIGCFVVAADTAGLRMVRALVLSAPHPLGEIAFQKARVPRDCRLDVAGDAGGGGFKLGLATLDRVRATGGAAACGMAARALAEALAPANSRRQFGKPLAGLQLTQGNLGRMA